MTESPSATNAMIAEDLGQSQEAETNLKRHSIFSRVELNLEKFSIWSPKPRHGTKFVDSKVVEYEPERLPDGNLIQRKIEIVPTAKYGYPTTQTQTYCYALQKLWHESEFTVKKKGIVEFSRRQIIVDVLGLTYSKTNRRALDLSLNQMHATQLAYYYLFYDKARDEKYRELKKFHILTELNLTQRTKASEVIHEKCSVTFHPLITSNLLSGYYKPVLAVFSGINSEIGRILYTKLDLQFSHYTKYEISTERFFRENGLVGGEYKHPSGRRRKLENAIQELIGKPTSSGAVITKYEFARTADGKDWKLIVRSKGKRNRTVQAEVIESLQSVETDEQKPMQKAAQKPREKQHKAKKRQSKEETAPTSEKPLQSESGLHEGSEIFESATSFADASEVLNSEALELLKYFDSVFDLNSYLNKNDVPKAELFVERYSLSAGKFLVDFAHRQGSEPTRFSDILSYRAEALEAFKHQHQRRQSKKSEAKVIPIDATPDEADLKAIHHFHKKFGGRIQASEKIRSKVQSLIKAHSFDFAIFLVDFVQKKISELHSNYQPKSFSGILSSQSEALEEYEKGKRRKQQEKRQAQKLAEVKYENARLDHEKVYRGDYYEYVNELVCSLGDEYPSRFNEFRGWQAEQRREKENLEGNLREVSLRVFDSEGQSILRLTQFFQDDPDIHIPDFWEWDCQENPHRFTTEGE